MLNPNVKHKKQSYTISLIFFFISFILAFDQESFSQQYMINKVNWSKQDHRLKRLVHEIEAHGMTNERPTSRNQKRSALNMLYVAGLVQSLRSVISQESIRGHRRLNSGRQKYHEI